MNTLIKTSARADAPPVGAYRGNKSVVAGLHYLRPTRQRPHSYTYEPPPGVPWENCAYDRHAMPIADARLASSRPSIDREGFELRDAPTVVRDFLDVDMVRSIYYREAAELALDVTGAARALVFDHLVRRRERERAALTFGRRGRDGLPSANGRIHNDYTEASGRKRLRMVLAEADSAARVRRYGIVNVWRSIKGPVFKSLADGVDVGRRHAHARRVVERQRRLRHDRRKHGGFQHHRQCEVARPAHANGAHARTATFLVRQSCQRAQPLRDRTRLVADERAKLGADARAPEDRSTLFCLRHRAVATEQRGQVYGEACIAHPPGETRDMRADAGHLRHDDHRRSGTAEVDHFHRAVERDLAFCKIAERVVLEHAARWH